MKKYFLTAILSLLVATVFTSCGDNDIIWKSHATLTLLAKQDCPLWLQYD